MKYFATKKHTQQFHDTEYSKTKMEKFCVIYAIDFVAYATDFVTCVTYLVAFATDFVTCHKYLCELHAFLCVKLSINVKALLIIIKMALLISV